MLISPLLRAVVLVFGFELAIPATIVCAQTSTPQPGWKVLQLPYGWIINVPKEFITRKYQGIDSHPGVVRSRRRKIELEYDIITGSFEPVRKPDCDTTRAVIFGIGINYFDNYGDNGRRRVIQTSGEECRNGVYIGLSGTNLGEEGERLATEIFKTLRISYDIPAHR